MVSGAASGNGQRASLVVVTSTSPSGETCLEFLIRSNKSVASLSKPRSTTSVKRAKRIELPVFTARALQERGRALQAQERALQERALRERVSAELL